MIPFVLLLRARRWRITSQLPHHVFGRYVPGPGPEPKIVKKGKMRATKEVHHYFSEVPQFGSSRHVLLNPKNWFDPG